MAPPSTRNGAIASSNRHIIVEACRKNVMFVGIVRDVCTILYVVSDRIAKANFMGWPYRRSKLLIMVPAVNLIQCIA